MTAPHAAGSRAPRSRDGDAGRDGRGGAARTCATGSWVDDARLAACPLIQALDADARAALVGALSFAPMQKHELIVSEGAEARDVHILVRGAAMVWRRWHGLGAQVIGFLYPGDVLGALTGDTHLTSARAIAPGTLARLPASSLGDLAGRHVSLRHALYQTVVSEFALAQDHLTLLGTMCASERLATTLLRLDRRQQARGYGPDVPLWLPMRRTDLASYLGVELPTLSRAFSRLRAANVITLRSSSEVLLRDRRELARLAGDTADWSARQN